VTEVRVDGQAVQIGSSTYALQNIALATAEQSANRFTGIGMALMGVIPLVILLATGNTDGVKFGGGFGADKSGICFAVGGYIIADKKTGAVRVVKSGRVDVV